MTPARILVVEDEKIIAKGIEKRLKGLGYSVAGFASTGVEAIQKATGAALIVPGDVKVMEG